MKPARVSKLLLPCAPAICMMGILSLRPSPAAGGSPPQQAAAPQAGSVNNEDCAVCHEDQVKAFDRTPHAVLEKSKKLNMKNSCESCHGPGEAHVSNDGDKTKIITFKDPAAARNYNARCLDCHQKNHPVLGIKGSLHGKSNLACVDCHGIHKSERLTKSLKKRDNALCMDCHVEARTAFARPYRHRVKEDVVRCVDCHQPHSGLDRRMLRTSLSGDVPCTRCHAQTEGPFVYEHASLRIRDCQACHEPHGSNNPKMLIRPTVRSLCLECHSSNTPAITAQPPAFHDVRQPRYQNCTTCHVKIHGSNASRLFLR
jgi:DmsE family decaheme c-type cytochrome